MNSWNKLLALLIIACCIVACGDDDDDNNNDEMEPADMEGDGFMLPDGLTDTSVLLEFTTANDGAPYELGDEVQFSFSASGDLGIDTDPSANNGDELTLTDPAEAGSEIVWIDENNGFTYTLSLLADGSINEINLSSISDNTFLGQFTEATQGGSIITALANLAGTYTVDMVDLGTHSRNTVIIDADGNIDFDSDKQASVDDIADSNDVVLIDGIREIIVRYDPFPAEPYVEVIIEIDGTSEQVTTIEYRTVESPSLDRFKVAVIPN